MGWVVNERRYPFLRGRGVGARVGLDGYGEQEIPYPNRGSKPETSKRTVAIPAMLSHLPAHIHIPIKIQAWNHVIFNYFQWPRGKNLKSPVKDYTEVLAQHLTTITFNGVTKESHGGLDYICFRLVR
jgi:hypothetical protein